MHGLISRSAVLTASRLSNFAIQLFSPLLLVRILDVPDYGQYQEFMIYAMLLSTVCSFAMDSSLTYFIPRFPDRERSFVKQASLLILGTSTLCIGALFLAKPLFLKMTTYDFVAPLAGYVFFFVNLNWLEYYWIAKRQPQLVLYYSAIRLFLRITVLLLVAYTTRDVLVTIWSMVVVEGSRVLLVFVYFARVGMFRGNVFWSEVVEQLRFAAPVGASAFIQNASRSIGKIFISGTLGPAALAYYAAGSYIQPVVRVLRSGVQDAIYPELVRAHDRPSGALRLWQRVNVLNCVIFFPVFVLLIFYAEQIIVTLFTGTYQAAVPVFNVYAFFLIRRCFNADVLLRSTGQTGFMMRGTIGALIANVSLIPILAGIVGMIGPAIAFIVAEVMLEAYYMQRARQTLNLSIMDLADWRSIYRISISCGLALPILIGFGWLPLPEVIRMISGSVLYLSVVFLLAYRLGVADIGRVARFALSLLEIRLVR